MADSETVVMATDKAGFTHVLKDFDAPGPDGSHAAESRCGQQFSAKNIFGWRTLRSDTELNRCTTCTGWPQLPGDADAGAGDDSDDEQT